MLLLAQNGWVCGGVEERRGPLTFDWCQFADILGFRSGHRFHPWAAVQATGYGNFSNHVLKYLRDQPPALRQFLQAGHWFEIWAFKPDEEFPASVEQFRAGKNFIESSGGSLIMDTFDNPR